MYLGFGSRRSNDAFSHPHQQQLQHPDIDAMEQFTEDLGEGIEIPPQHRSSGFPLGDGRHPADTARMQHHQHPKLLNSDSISTMPPQPVDIEEFAGDLLPQRSTMAPPVTGSSRRKSPIRPMQVVRTEPLIYHDPVGDRNMRDTR